MFAHFCSGVQFLVGKATECVVGCLARGRESTHWQFQKISPLALSSLSLLSHFFTFFSPAARAPDRLHYWLRSDNIGNGETQEYACFCGDGNDLDLLILLQNAEL